MDVIVFSVTTSSFRRVFRRAGIAVGTKSNNYTLLKIKTILVVVEVFLKNGNKLLRYYKENTKFTSY